MAMTERATANASTEQFRTHDLFLSAFLLAKGALLLDHTREGGRVTFVFAGEPNPQVLARDFWNGAPVNVSAYVQALQTLKSVIHGFA